MKGITSTCTKIPRRRSSKPDRDVPIEVLHLLAPMCEGKWSVRPSVKKIPQPSAHSPTTTTNIKRQWPKPNRCAKEWRDQRKRVHHLHIPFVHTHTTRNRHDKFDVIPTKIICIADAANAVGNVENGFTDSKKGNAPNDILLLCTFQ